MSTLKELALKELAIRELEKRHEKERNNLVDFISFFFKNEINKDFQINWHHRKIAEALDKVLAGKITRLMINIPPGSGKTELITKCFPVWSLGKNPDTQIIATGYSAQLTTSYGSQARDYYRSETFRKVFPRSPKIRDDQDTKGLWRNDLGGQFLATGVGGSITGNRANIFLIDDPIKPDEAENSETMRLNVNRWYDTTVLSRLFNPDKDAVIIVMQRTHEDDLCGYLLEKMKNGSGEKWEQIIIPAIALEDEEFRKQGESYHEERMPLTALNKIKSNSPVVFSTQYQQTPTNKDSQEFHEEFFKYYEELPTIKENPAVRLQQIFTVVDPAFKQGQENDDSCIMTVSFIEDKCYILEYTAGKYDASILIDKICYHLKKWGSRKVGVEAYAAQTVIGQFLKKRMIELGINTPVEEITQTGDKVSKIRKLVEPIRRGLIFWKKDMSKLENQLVTFPRAKHDDVVDALQMCYNIYKLPNKSTHQDFNFTIKYDQLGRPIFN